MIDDTGVTLTIIEPSKEHSTAALAAGKGFPSKDELKALPYAEFLVTPYWKHVAELVKKRDGYRCRVCNGQDRLAAHHRTYEHHGEEHLFLGDLTTLCEACHTRHHFPPKPEAVRVATPKPSKRPLRGKARRFFAKAAIKLGIKQERLAELGFDKVVKMLEAHGYNAKGKRLTRKAKENSRFYDFGRGYRKPTKYMDYEEYKRTMHPDKSAFERALGI